MRTITGLELPVVEGDAHIRQDIAAALQRWFIRQMDHPELHDDITGGTTMSNRKDGMMNRLCMVFGLALCLAGALPVGAWEDSEARLAEWCALSADMETPHTKWAKPDAQGKLRVLYFVGSNHEGMDVRVREAVEFRQRFDVELEAVYWFNFHNAAWYGGVAGLRRLNQLLDRPWDLFVFQDVSPDNITTWPDIEGRNPHTQFMNAVRNGAGVVMIGCDSTNYLKDRVAATLPVPALEGVPVESLSTFGKGRVVKLASPPVIPFRPGWEWRYDRQQEQLGRAALYAARSEPATRLKIELPAAALDRAALPGPALTLAWSGAKAKGARCQAYLRRDDGERIALGEAQPCAGADGRATFPLPRLRAGTYHVYGFLDSDRGREAWAAGDLAVTAGAGVGEIRIASGARLPFAQVEGNKERQEAMEERLGTHLPYFEIGQTIEGTVTATNAAGCRLRVELLDLYDRVLFRQESAATAPAAFRYPVEAWMPMAARIRATLLDKDGEVAAADAFCRVVKRNRDRFNFVLWGGPGDATLAPYALQTLKRMGVTAIYSTAPPSLAMAKYGMAAVPFTGGNVNAAHAEGWNDPASASYWVKHVGRARSHGALAYSLGDEGHTAGYGNGPKTLAAWQTYLKTEYKEIDALNKSWGANFTNFEAIGELGFKSAQAPSALPNCAPAFDLAAFSGHNFVQMAKINIGELRREMNEPEAVIGFEGAGDLRRTMHADEICRDLGMWVPYSGYLDEFIRGFAPRSFQRSIWMGYGETGDGHCGRYYYGLVNGADSAWYWMWSTMPFQGFQKPDLAGGVPAVEDFVADTRFVREGLGDLLLKYGMADDGITLLYSKASNWLSAQSKLPIEPYGPYAWIHMIWATALHDLGLQYNYVTDDAIRAGQWDSKGCKVVILSSTFALSPETAKALRAFVERGGAVIADVRPGFYDHHARPHDPTGKTAALDDLFGIRGAFPPRMEVSDTLSVTGEVAGVKLRAFTTPNAEFANRPLSDPGIEAVGARPAGQAGAAPVVLVNKVGKGHAVLLNFALWSAMSARLETPNMGGQGGAERTPYPFGVFLRDIFAALDVRPAVEVTPHRSEREFVGNLRVQRWRNGDNEIVALFRQTGNRETEEKMVNVSTFAGRRYVYDIRNGLGVGYAFGAKRGDQEGNWWLSEVVPTRASFFALTPGPVRAPALELPATARRGAVLTARVAAPNAKGLHALRLRARTPDGTPFEHWEQTVITDANGTTVRLPLAFNDPAGRWDVTLTDCFSPEAATHAALTVE